jgi:hypothetical protein
MPEKVSFGCRQESVMPYPDKPTGQDVKTEPANKLTPRQSHDLLFVVIPIIPPTKRNSCFIDIYDPMIADGYLMGVTSQVINYLVGTCERLFGIYHPIGFIELPDQHFIYIEGFLQTFHELTPEYAGKAFYVKQKYLPVGRYRYLRPTILIIHSAPWNNAVYMGMQREVLPPGMENGYNACFSMVMGKGELQHCVPGARKKKVVHLNGMMHEQPVELIGQSKNYMKIGNRQKIPFAVFNPCFALGVLAFGAMTVTTGVVTDAKVPALIATVNMATQRCGAATLQGAQRPTHVCIGKVLFDELFAVTVDYLSQFKDRSHPFSYNRSNGLKRLLRLGLAT